MADPAGFGPKKFLQVGLESVWGTAVAATHRFGILDFSVMPDVGLAADRTAIGSVNPNPPIPTINSVQFSFSMIADYDLMGILYDWAFGTATFGSQGSVDSGANPYDHTMNDAKALFNSLTMQWGEGDIPASKCSRITGAKCTGMTLSATGSPGDQALVRASFTGIGAVKTYNQTPTSLSDRTRANMLWTHITTMTNGSADASSSQSILSFEYSITNPLSSESTGRVPTTIDEPQLNGFRQTSYRLTQRMHTKTLQELYQAQDSSQFIAPSLVLTSGTKILTLTIPKGRLAAPADPDFSGDGIFNQTLSYECANGGSYASQFVLRNAKATVLTV